MTGTRHNGNGHDPQHVTETPDVSHIKNLDVTHEASDVSVSGVAKFVLGLTVLGVVVFVLMWGMFRVLDTQEGTKEPQPGPMAMTEQERLPPEPRLQAARGFGVTLENGERVPLEKREPEAEYRVLREQWERVLREGAKDQSGKIVALPIDQAMEKVLAVGLPSRKQDNASASIDDYRLNLPTAASSGRMTEKGRQ